MILLTSNKIKYFLYTQEPPVSLVLTTSSPSHHGLVHALPLGMAGGCLTVPSLFCPRPLQSSLWVVADSHSPVMLILCLFIALLRLSCSDD